MSITQRLDRRAIFQGTLKCLVGTLSHTNEFHILSTDIKKIFNFSEHEKEMEFHLWYWSLKETGTHIDSLYDLLSNEEKIKAASFRFKNLKENYMISHGVLRCILGDYLRLDPGDIIFQSGDTGKPAIAETQNYNNIKFSLAHSDNYAICAITSTYEIGVDIEEDHWISPEELISLSKYIIQPGEDNPLIKNINKVEFHEFLDTWTIKEAFCKALGSGLGLLKESWIHDCVIKGNMNTGRVGTKQILLPFANFRLEDGRLFVSVAIDFNPGGNPV